MTEQQEKIIEQFERNVGDVRDKSNIIHDDMDSLKEVLESEMNFYRDALEEGWDSCRYMAIKMGLDW